MNAPRWRLRLLGSVAASDGHDTIERFGSGAVAALAARLALYPARSHGREELVELLWPEVAPEVGRNRLRQTLHALRALLEPPSAIPRPVLVADRASIRVVAGALGCDVAEFERAVREGRHADALALYAGELMPGHYDEWIADERRRLAALAERAGDASAAAGAVPRPPPPPLAESAPAAARRERSPLPLYLTRFFGREAETASVRAAIGTHRLVTLLGPGGCGKTRLVAEACAGSQEQGVAARLLLFVPLVGCASRAALVESLAGALRLQLGGGDDALARVIEALEARPILLVLDNFEQLVEAGGDVVAALVGALPALHVLVTSRRALGLDGEQCLVLGPLPLPAEAAGPNEVASSAALGLFVDRARAVRADFHLSERNVAALTGLVRVLEGLPLALELAASRVRSVSPAEMLEHLRPPPGAPRAGLALLARSGVRAGHDPRHASMLRTIEWSWQLLGEPLQRFLAELTVFEGGFTAAAAAAVTRAGEGAALVRLDELVSHSLLGVQRLDAGTDAGAARYALDESIREFAALALGAADARALRARHRHWLAAWGAALPPSPPLAALRAESRNLGAALASALADGAPEEGVAAMVALRRGLPDTAVPATQLAALATALDATADSEIASRGHSLLARLNLAAGSVEAARRHAWRGLAIARALHAAGGAGHATGEGLLGRALQVAASVSWRTSRDAAASEALLDEAAPHVATQGDLALRGSALALRAFIANIAHRDLARAEQLHAEALALWLRAGDAVSANTGRYNLAVCALRARRHDEVLERLTEVRAEAERQHDWRLLSQGHNVAGEAHAGRRDWPAAIGAYRQSLELAWNALAQPSFAYALWNLPLALAHGRDAERAAALAGAAERVWTERMGELDAGDKRDQGRLRRLAEVQIGAAAVARHWRAGAGLSLPEIVALALGKPVPP